ncbi:MAG: hypothetical protein QXU31_08425 [Archaeoglobaceae archaeon]
MKPFCELGGTCHVDRSPEERAKMLAMILGQPEHGTALGGSNVMSERLLAVNDGVTPEAHFL